MPDEALLSERWLTSNFSLDELTHSQEAERRGICNIPGPEVRRNLLRLALWLEDLRALLGGRPVLISSGYRGAKVNAAIKGSKNSLHMQGLAADFTVPRFGTPLQVCRVIESSLQLDFEELIFEGTWVHVGLPIDTNKKPARRVLTARFQHGRPTTYKPGLTS